MKILYICWYAAPYKGNFIESLMALDKAYNGHQNACYILPLLAKDKPWVEELQRDGAKIFFNTGSILGELRLQKKICKKYKIDIIYHHFWNLKDCLANRLLKISYPRTKMILHHHNEYHISESKFREKIKHWILDADMHICCGQYVSKEVAYAGFRNVKWIDNCIDFSRLDKYENYDVPNGLNLLTFSSYSYDIKGIDISIKGIAEARKEGVPVNLFIVVAGNFNEVRNRVLAECNGNIPEWIKLLPSRPDVATYYHAVDAYLNSSRSEGFCYSSIEAVYCGAQVLQSNIPGNRLDVPHSYISKVEDIEDLTENVLKFHEAVKYDDSDVRRLQHDYVCEKYSLDTWTKEEIETIEELF